MGVPSPQCLDDVPQRQQGAVDILGLFEPLSLCPGLPNPLRASQVHQVQLPCGDEGKFRVKYWRLSKVDVSLDLIRDLSLSELFPVGTDVFYYLLVCSNLKEAKEEQTRVTDQWFWSQLRGRCLRRWCRAGRASESCAGSSGCQRWSCFFGLWLESWQKQEK